MTLGALGAAVGISVFDDCFRILDMNLERIKSRGFNQGLPFAIDMDGPSFQDQGAGYPFQARCCQDV